MRRLLLATVIGVAAFAPSAPALASHCDVQYKSICVSVCGTANLVLREVDEELACA